MDQKIDCGSESANYRWNGSRIDVAVSAQEENHKFFSDVQNKNKTEMHIHWKIRGFEY